MPGKRITIAQKRRLINLVLELGLPISVAAERVGISKASAARIIAEARSSGVEEVVDQGPPAPKTWDELSEDAKEALRDFSVFETLFLARRTAPWRRDAANRIIEFLMNTEERSFVIMNTFPGAGKSTLFTHDIPAWLIAGGGFCDPRKGRAIRIMLGADTQTVSEHYVARLRATLENREPYYDHQRDVAAELSLVEEFGYFKPLEQEGRLWRADQFTVQPISGYRLSEKEPTVQAASRDKGFLGERVNLAVWDDLVTFDNSRNPSHQGKLAAWFEEQAERRIEPGGALVLVGQRFGPHDLFRDRLDREIIDPETGERRKKYHLIRYPAHHDDLCDGKHREWDGKDDGCLTDAWRLPWREVLEAQSGPNYRTLYQQEDIDPGRALVHPVWLDGGRDPWGVDCPGCLDKDRGFFEVPKGVGELISYATVDPAAGLWWAIEWWAVRVEEPHVRYLIWGHRAKMKAGDLLDWDPDRKVHVGYMEEIQRKSREIHLPIRVWVIEAVSAFRHLFQFVHFRSWKMRHPDVAVIAHETQRNKHDPELGVEALLPPLYRAGLKRLPYKQGDLDAIAYVKVKRKELTEYPDVVTIDTVMADWFGETNMKRILSLARRRSEVKPQRLYLPPYLVRQREERFYGEEMEEEDALHV
jgi:hypothetical protein